MNTHKSPDQYLTGLQELQIWVDKRNKEMADYSKHLIKNEELKQQLRRQYARSTQEIYTNAKHHTSDYPDNTVYDMEDLDAYLEDQVQVEDEKMEPSIKKIPHASWIEKPRKLRSGKIIT